MNRVFAYGLVVVVAAVALVLTGCTSTEKGVGIGTLVGGGAGAVIGHQTGHTAGGALIGAGAGAVAGGLIGHEVGKVKYCPTCGDQHQEETQFCPKDGTQLLYRK
jgi:uncharacterized protein YcfJ